MKHLELVLSSKIWKEQISNAKVSVDNITLLQY